MSSPTVSTAPRRWSEHPSLDDATRLNTITRANGPIALSLTATGFGLLRCRGRSRWMWGTLKTVFLVHGHPASVDVSAWTIRGRMVWTVPLGEGVALSHPPSPSTATSVERPTLRAPAPAVNARVRVDVPHVRFEGDHR